MQHAALERRNRRDEQTEGPVWGWGHGGDRLRWQGYLYPWTAQGSCFRRRLGWGTKLSMGAFATGVVPQDEAVAIEPRKAGNDAVVIDLLPPLALWWVRGFAIDQGPGVRELASAITAHRERLDRAPTRRAGALFRRRCATPRRACRRSLAPLPAAHPGHVRHRRRPPRPRLVAALVQSPLLCAASRSVSASDQCLGGGDINPTA